MKKTAFLITAILMLTAAADAQEITVAASQYENALQVTGKSEKEVVPDEIYIRIVISENDTKGKVSVDKLEQKMITGLRGIGIDVDKELKVGDMSSDFKEYWLRRNDTRTTKSYELKVSDAATLTSVFQKLESLGISNLSITKISHSRLEELQDEARVEAIRNARKVADSLAEAIGQKAGRAVYIVDYNNDIMPMARSMAMNDLMDVSAAGSFDQAESRLEFKTIKIKYSVNAKFILE